MSAKTDFMPIRIRPFVPEDYERIAEINTLTFPKQPETALELKERDSKRDAKCYQFRFVADNEAGTVIGHAEYDQHPWQYHPRKFGFWIAVHPDFQRQGVGTQLFEYIRADMERFEPISLSTYEQEDQAGGMAFLSKNGFREVMREWESVFEPAAFDFAPYAADAERVAAQGIVIKTLRELESDPDRDRKLYNTEMQVSLDMPSSEASTVPTFEDWKKNTFENIGLIPDGYFIAVDTTADNAYVGLSQLWASQASKTLHTGATGVLPEYRRRGIALALKLRAIAYAKETGAPQIKTWNAQINRAMLSINERLGFVKEPAWIEHRKEMRPEPIKIRTATPRDYAIIAEVLNAVWHEWPVTPDEIKHRDETRDAKMRFDRFIAEADGKAVGVGEYSQSPMSYDPQKFGIGIMVLPEYQGQGYGKALYEHVLSALRPFNPHTYRSGTIADRERAVRFLEERGFELTQREQSSRANPATFEPGRYADELAKVAEQGIAIKTFAELKETESDLYNKMESMMWEVSQDIPHTEELTRPSMEQFLKMVQSPRFLTEGNFIAVDTATGELVGISMLWGSKANNDLHTGMTGVLRTYRKRGIATALKIRALTHAKQHGADWVWTSNEVGNVGMLGINFRFGFEKQPEELEYRKRVTTNG